MCTYFKSETDLSQNLIHDFFFQSLTVGGPFHGKDFIGGKYGWTGLLSVKTELLYKKLNERVEAATSSYSETGDFFTIYLFCACS